MKKLISAFLIIMASCGRISDSEGFKNEDFERIEDLKSRDTKLGLPKPGEWLHEHKEPGQSFDQYKNSKPVSPFGDRRNIYLLPIGEFSEEQDRIIQFTAEYLELFFDLKTVVSEPISDKLVPPRCRRMREDGNQQLLTTYLLDSVIAARIPNDGIVVMGITAKDLYPADSWNYVFGQARLKHRVGVSSIFRYSEEPVNSLNYTVCLERLIKTSSHEIGHMFSCQHCTYAVCVMNGSNSLAESDTRPNRLCSECHKKLCWNLKFDVRKRIERLTKFFLKHKLKLDCEAAQGDLKMIF